MLDRWRSFRDTVDDTTASIRAVFFMGGVVAMMVVGLRSWLHNLDDIQTIALWIALVCFGLVCVTYYLDWQRKKSVDKIPELLAQLDQFTLDSIREYEMNNAPEQLLNDLASLMHLDVGGLKAAASSGDKKRAEKAFVEFGKKYEKYSSVIAFKDNIMNLRLAGALMDEYNVGLASIRNTPEYQRIYQRVTYLRRRVPSATISAKINDYFHQSEALYSMLLSVKPFETLGTLSEMIPAKMRAQSDIIFPITEGHIDNLISAVRESISDYKKRDRSPSDRAQKEKRR